MIALGIDPGTRRIGYGIVEKKKDNTLRFVAAGILKIASADDTVALTEAKKGIMAVIKKYKPGVMGIEKLFFAKNQRTAMAVAQARGVLVLAAYEAGVPIKEYTPNEIKLGVTGYGFADKKAVLKMEREANVCSGLITRFSSQNAVRSSTKKCHPAPEVSRVPGIFSFRSRIFDSLPLQLSNRSGHSRKKIFLFS
jgi:crossover junction endodeoxyribonuclease RuvC